MDDIGEIVVIKTMHQFSVVPTPVQGVAVAEGYRDEDPSLFETWRDQQKVSG